MFRKASKKSHGWLLLLFLAVSMVSLLILYNALIRLSENDVLYTYQKAISQMALNIDERMAMTEETISSILFDTRLQDSMKRTSSEETLENQLKEIKDLRELVYLTEKSRNIARIRIYLNDKKLITHEGINFFPFSRSQEAEEYALLDTVTGKHIWIPEHYVQTRYYEGYYLTYGCLYHNFFRGGDKSTTMVLLDLTPDCFDDIFDSIQHADEGFKFIVADRSGHSLFGNETPTAVPDQVLQYNNGEWTGYLQDKASNKDTACIIHQLENKDWYLIMEAPRENLLNSHKALRSSLTLAFCGLAFLIVALMALLILAVYSRGIRVHIRHLEENLRSNGKAYKPEPTHQSLFNLDQSINKLLETNRQLEAENYQAQLREREVTLQSLQAQINPHFLYNTLDSINWMAIREKAMDASSAISSLADYFRLSLNNGKNIVTLKEDVEIARKYVDLYSFRFDYDYEIKWNIEQETENCLIPKLTLQPLVENAFHHGIFKRADKSGGKVYIHACMEEKALLIEVADNGPGFVPGQPLKKGYGLSNVCERLDLYFEGKYSFDCSTEPDGYTIFTVRIQ